MCSRLMLDLCFGKMVMVCDSRPIVRSLHNAGFVFACSDLPDLE